MTEPIYLLLGIHNHQPVGNFGDVFERAFKNCYWPLVRLLEKYPDVKMALHHSGPLLDWATEHELSYIPTLAALVARGQVEIMGGGYYEPILSTLKHNDALGQISLMQEFWNRATGSRPRGMWLAERVWEPSLAQLIAEAGLQYTILDDEHFRYAGLSDDTFMDYYRTERAGSSIAVFPSDKTMRYLIPFKPVEDVISHLLKLRDERPGCAITYGDDGEKFGMWPGTFEWVIKKGWLEKFFQQLTEHRHEIVTMHFAEFLGHKPAAGNVYLPTASYNEMLEWAMPAQSIVRYEDVKHRIERAGLMDEARPFLRGGLWDNFLAKYPESNLMHKKAIYVSNRIDQAEKSHDVAGARRALYRAQCNCAYWHGLFGGLYLNYLRNAIYENLIEAENIIDAKQYGDTPFVRKDDVDIDGDGTSELVMASDKLIATVAPARGGSLVELSWRPAKLNLLNTMARRFEAYHRPDKHRAHHDGGEVPTIHNIAKDIGEQGKLIYDELPRYSFMEHLLSNDGTTPVASFADAPFTVVRSDASDMAITAQLIAKRHAKGDQGGSYRLSKSYRLERSSIGVDYELVSHAHEEIVFAVELNLTLLAGHDPQRYYQWGDVKPGTKLMDARETVDHLSELTLVDKAFGLKLAIRASDEAKWRFEPVETVSQSESGFDRFYQGSNIWIYFTPHFSEANSARFSVCLSLDGL